MYFSVITAIYNVEQHIDRGIQYILGQNFKDFEIILSDDGSTDQSPALCDKYAQIDSRVKVIHGTNEGAGEARNRAIRVARGNYLCFFDIDDFVDNEWLTTIRRHIESSQPQVLVYGYRERDPFYRTTISFCFKDKCYNSNDEIRQDYVSEFSGIKFNNGFLWNKVYERKFIVDNGIWFENQRIQQDEVFNCKVYRVADTLRTIPDVLYDYYIYNSGNTRSRFIPDRLEIYRSVRDALTALKDYWQLDSPALTEYIQKRFFRSVLDYLDFNLHHPQAGLTVAERRKVIEEVMQADDVICCIDYLLAHTQLSPREHRYAMSLLQRDVRGYEHLRKYDRAKSLLKIYIRTLLNRIHS